MDDFLYNLISGVGFGAIIALIALGYTLVYGIIKLINFAHGEFLMAGAYAGYGVYMLMPADIPAPVKIPIILLTSGIAGALIGGATEKIAYKPIRKNGRLAALLTAIGVSFFLQNLFAFVKDAKSLDYDSGTEGSVGYLCQTSIKIGENGIAVIYFVYLAITIILMIGLWWIVMRTSFGRAMRALSQDQDAAALMGVNVNSVISRTFILGGFLAGIAGSLLAFQSNISPTMGVMPGLKAFIAAVVGGIGSIPGAVLGGFFIGIMGEMLIWAGLPSAYKDIAVFLLLIIILVVRPQGILGKLETEKV